MRVIPPINITAGMITSSTVAEPDAGETVWVSGTSYAVGATVIRVETHRVYKCKVAVSGSTPPENDGASWDDIGATNQWKMFDLYRNDKTVGGTTLTVVLTPGQRIDSIGLGGLVGTSYSVSISSASFGGVLYTTSGLLLSRSVSTFYEWATTPFKQTPRVSYFDVPPYADSVITITVIDASAASIGSIYLGRSIYVGDTQYGVKNSIFNFSKFERKGDSVIVDPKQNSPTIRQVVIADKAKADVVYDLREAINGKVCFWLGIDDYLDGYYKTLSATAMATQLDVDVSSSNIIKMDIELTSI